MTETRRRMDRQLSCIREICCSDRYRRPHNSEPSPSFCTSGRSHPRPQSTLSFDPSMRRPHLASITQSTWLWAPGGDSACVGSHALGQGIQPEAGSQWWRRNANICLVAGCLTALLSCPAPTAAQTPPAQPSLEETAEWLLQRLPEFGRIRFETHGNSGWRSSTQRTLSVEWRDRCRLVIRLEETHRTQLSPSNTWEDDPRRDSSDITFTNLSSGSAAVKPLTSDIARDLPQLFVVTTARAPGRSGPIFSMLFTDRSHAERAAAAVNNMIRLCGGQQEAF
jgi:hypothetical protein